MLLEEGLRTEVEFVDFFEVEEVVATPKYVHLVHIYKRRMTPSRFR
jgi:hypothetical protein